MSDEKQLKIFIVDDDKDIRSSLSRSLSKRGYEIESFSSATSFLSAYNDRTQGCLLLDYGMPELNGLELQKHMVEHNLSIPIIFMTGHGGIPESVQAMKAGAVDFLEKPFKQDALIEAIETAFEKARSGKEEDETKRDLLAKLDRLTSREREVAAFMALNSADTSSKYVSRHLNVSPRTVDHHRARILEKMDMKSVSELIEKSIKHNLFS